MLIHFSEVTICLVGRGSSSFFSFGFLQIFNSCDCTFRFIEDDFDTYVSQMRKPLVWGGEPEILMACHVLQ